MPPLRFSSPLRGPWLTTLLGSVLLAMVAIVATTGFLSHAAYMPDLAGNRIVAHALPLTFDWPTRPAWIYALTQSLHTNVGLVAIPFLLAKLWSVIPKLFVWPPVSSPAQGLERLSIALLVSSSVFEFVTGVLNIQYWYAFKFNFVVAHYYGAVVFVSALVLHVLVKLPAMRRGYRTRAEIVETATMSRRGLFAFAGAASASLLVANVGVSIGGPVRKLAFLAPRRTSFPVNKTAAAAAGHGGHGRAVVRARPERWSAGGAAVAAAAAGARAAHAGAPDRVRGGLDDDADMDGRAARHAGSAGGRAQRRRPSTSARCSRRACSRRPLCHTTRSRTSRRCWR